MNVDYKSLFKWKCNAMQMQMEKKKKINLT